MPIRSVNAFIEDANLPVIGIPVSPTTVIDYIVEPVMGARGLQVKFAFEGKAVNFAEGMAKEPGRYISYTTPSKLKKVRLDGISEFALEGRKRGIDDLVEEIFVLAEKVSDDYYRMNSSGIRRLWDFYGRRTARKNYEKGDAQLRNVLIKIGKAAGIMPQTYGL